MLFTLAPNDEHDFNVAKFVWEREDTIAIQKKAEMAQEWVKRKTYFSQVPHEANKIASRYASLIHNPIFLDLDPIVLVND